MDKEATERSRVETQRRLDAQKTPAERNRLGQFATPSALARQIAEYVATLWPRRGIALRFLDPALGTGAFFSALLQSLGPSRVERAAGVEIDRDFADAARAIWRGSGLSLRCADFTRLKPPSVEERFNLVLTNPPYVRHHHISSVDKQRLQGTVRQSLQLDVSGLAGLYVYFLLLAHDWMAEGGHGVWLIPSEFMSVNYGAAIRRYLTQHVRLLRIHRFRPADMQFSDALVTSCVVVFQKARPRPGATARVTLGGSMQSPELVADVPVNTLKAATKWTGYPSHPENGSRTEPGQVTLGDLFVIKRGIATGANQFFIMRRDLAQERDIPEDVLRPILPSPRFLDGSVVERDEDGWPAIEGQLALIDTTMAEPEIESCYPALWAYLQQGLADGVRDRYLVQRRSPWYSQEQRDPPPFLCTYMGRFTSGSQPFRFIWNQSEAIAANVYLLLYPKGFLGRALRKQPGLAGAVFDGLLEIEPENFMAEGRVYGGGLYKVEPKELSAVSGQGIVDRVPGVAPYRQTALGS